MSQILGATIAYLTLLAMLFGAIPSRAAAVSPERITCEESCMVTMLGIQHADKSYQSFDASQYCDSVCDTYLKALLTERAARAARKVK